MTGATVADPQVTERSSPVRIAVWLGLSLLVAYLMFMGGGWAGIYSTDLRSISIVLIAVVLVAWAIAAVRNRAWLPRSALLPAFLVALAAFAVGLVLSRNPRLGIEYFAYSVLLTCLYLLLVRLLADKWFRERLMGIVVILTLLHGFAYLLQVFGAWIEWWQIVGRVTTPPLRPGFASLLLGNPSAVMTVQVLLAIASVSWVGWGSRTRQVLSGVIVFLAISATVVSGSRSGWLALAGAFVIWAALWLAAGPRRSALLGRLKSKRTRFGVIALAGVVGLLAAVLAPGVLFRAAAGGETYRLANYAEAARMFADEPLHGVGPGMWVAERIRYTIPTEPDYYIPYGHNLPLQTLAEFGLIGGIAGVVVALLLARLLWSALRDGDVLRRRIAWGALLATLYFFAHQLFDFYGNMPAALFAYAVPVALLDAIAPGERVAGATFLRQTRAQRLIAVGAGAGAIASIVILIAVESTAAIAARAVDLADDGRWSEALPLAVDAATRDPKIPAYQFTLAVVADHADRPDLAAAAYRTAASADDFPPSWLGVAAMATAAGNVDGAKSALERALRLGRQSTAILVAAADLYLRLDDNRSAAKAFGSALAIAPSLAGDKRWTTDPRLADVRQQAFSEARRLASGSTLIELAIEAGDELEAARLIRDLPQDQRTAAERYADVLEGDATAAASIETDARAHPLAMDTVLLAARANARRGDSSAADEFRFWADTLNGLASISSYDFRFGGPKIQVDKLAGLPGRLYGHYTYRRPTPADQVPAGVLHVVYE
jgi:O-antigen ligase